VGGCVVLKTPVKTLNKKEAMAFEFDSQQGQIQKFWKDEGHKSRQF